MRTFLKAVVTVLAIAGLVAIVVAAEVVRGGFTARAKPSALEGGLAALVEDAAVASARNVRSPVTATPAILAAARRDFARECAICHGNDGAGAPLGRAMFPAVPDLETSTQDLTEGEIFHVIENGIRWSGMPAFGERGDEEEAREHWALVAFIRHLPELLEAEVEEMRAVNPRGVEEWERLRREGKVPRESHEGHHGHH
jgi:mono/diheme cytochrome c family protein